MESQSNNDFLNENDSEENLSKSARNLLVNKEWFKAYEAYKIVISKYNNSNNIYTYYNNIMVCIVNIINNIINTCVERDENIVDYVEKLKLYLYEYNIYINLYLEYAKNNDTKKWAENIILDIFSNALELIILEEYLINKKNYGDESIKERIRKMFDSFVVCFCERSVFKKFIFVNKFIEKINSEYSNFRRVKYKLNNINITKDLINSFILSVKNDPFCNVEISYVVLLLSDIELIYSTNQDYKLTLETVIENLKKALNFYNENKYAKIKLDQTVQYLITKNQIDRFFHDVSSLIGRMKNIKEKYKDSDFYNEVNSFIDEIDTLFILSRNETPKISKGNIRRAIDEIIYYWKDSLSIKIIENGYKEDFYFSKNYLKIVFDNLLKNSFEAYKKNNINIREILITVDYQEGSIKVDDWAGGIDSAMLKDDLLFLPYVSSKKGIERNLGLGLSIVKNSMEAQKGYVKCEVFEEEDGRKGSRFLLFFKKEIDV